MSLKLHALSVTALTSTSGRTGIYTSLRLAFLARRENSGTQVHSIQQHEYALPCVLEIHWRYLKSR